MFKKTQPKLINAASSRKKPLRAHRDAAYARSSRGVQLFSAITSGPGVMSVSGPGDGHRHSIEIRDMAARRRVLADLDRRVELVERLRDAVARAGTSERRGPQAAPLDDEKHLWRRCVGRHQPVQLASVTECMSCPCCEASQWKSVRRD